MLTDLETKSTVIQDITAKIFCNKVRIFTYFRKFSLKKLSEILCIMADFFQNQSAPIAILARDLIYFWLLAFLQIKSIQLQLNRPNFSSHQIGSGSNLNALTWERTGLVRICHVANIFVSSLRTSLLFLGAKTDRFRWRSQKS